MKTGILYYSETGNTEMMARTLAGEIPDSFLLSLSGTLPERMPAADHWFVGCPVHGDKPPEKIMADLVPERLAGQPVSFFFTHTGPMADPSTVRFIETLGDWVQRSGWKMAGEPWHCRGENKRPDVVEWLRINMPDRYENTKTALGLPSDADRAAIRVWARTILKQVSGE